MRNSTYLLLGLALSLRLTQAQSITAGLKGGLNVSRLSFGQPTDPVVDNTWSPTFHLGGFLRKAVSEQTSVRIELLYSIKGCRFTQVSGDGYVRLQYLSLPVLLDLQVTKKLAVEVGPEFSYLLRQANFLYNNKFDLGIDAGLRYSVNPLMDVGLRYNYGLSGVAKLDFGSGLSPVRNQALQVSFAYKLLK